MLGFVGLNLAFDRDAVSPVATNITGIDEVTLKNGIVQRFNANSDITTDWSDTIPAQWDNKTIMDAKFIGSVAAGNVDYIADQLSSVLVKRREANKPDAPWITLFEIPIADPEDLSFTVLDFFNQSNVEYVYSLVPILIQEQSGVQVEVEGNYEISDSVMSWFDGVFISDRSTFYRLMSGMNYGSLEMVQNVGIHETLSNKYPIIVANSDLGYQKSSVGATVVPVDFLENGNLDRKDMVDRRQELMNFMTDKSPKILKDGNGNIWLVMFTGNPQVTFDNNYGMGIGDISADWTEIGSVSSREDLYHAGIIDVRRV